MQHHIVDWVYSKTQVLLVTLKTQSQHQEELYVLCELDVQEADISISQFYRIGILFFGCWIANGWITCSRFLGYGDRSIVLHEQRQNTDQTDVWKLMRDKKLLA